MPRLKISHIDRFWTKVKLDPSTGCWEWQAGKRDGYGSFKADGVGMGAHRWIMSYYLGRTLRSDEFVCHRCDNPGCANLSHLWIGSSAENTRDAVQKGRHCGSVTACPSGHPYVPENTRTVGNRRHCVSCYGGKADAA